MFKKRTLFILGAGASYEVDVPTGVDLAKRIATKLDVRYDDFGKNIGEGDVDLLSQFEGAFPSEFNKCLQAGWRIRNGVRLASSIDDFLDMHSHDSIVQLVGKAAIVKAIIQAERLSFLYYLPNNDHSRRQVVERIEGSWFMRFARILGRSVTKANANKVFDNVSFIVFNYDRCLEFFLLNALQAMYDISSIEAASIINRLSIIHPYGVIGELPELGNRNQIPFGGDTNFNNNTIAAAKLIKTYTEQIGGAGEINAIKAEIEQADQIVFLGFAYHEQNMQLLRPRGELQRAIPIFGTARGMSNTDVSATFQQLRSWFAPSSLLSIKATTIVASSMSEINNIHIENAFSCADLFDNYAKSFAAGA